MSKISNIHDSSGMAHLIKQANPERPPEPPQWPADKCLKLRCLLETTEYYIPNGEAGIIDQAPYFPFGFAVGYSEVRAGVGSPNVVVAIIKHIEKRFFQTGISTEVVDLPSWWDRRDSWLG